MNESFKERRNNVSIYSEHHFTVSLAADWRRRPERQKQKARQASQNVIFKPQTNNFARNCPGLPNFSSNSQSSQQTNSTFSVRK